MTRQNTSPLSTAPAGTPMRTTLLGKPSCVLQVMVLWAFTTEAKPIITKTTTKSETKVLRFINQTFQQYKLFCHNYSNFMMGCLSLSLIESQCVDNP
jgi:hypothetical protein